MTGIIWESKKEDLDVKRFRFAEILACFLLPTFCLLAASFLGIAEGEAYEPEKADMMQEQEEEESAEDNSVEVSEDIWQEKADTEEISEFLLEWNHNPYFFPEGVTTVGYDADFDITGVDGEMEVKLSVREELVLENGILYSMKIMNEGDLRFYDSMILEEDKKRMDFGYFYVQPDKIYWIKDLEAGEDISERELMEEGRIVCQLEPLEPDTEPDEDGCYGGVGIQGDMCTFGRSQGGEGTFYWEDFVWLKGFGLIEYRSGWGACRDMIYIMMR